MNGHPKAGADLEHSHLQDVLSGLLTETRYEEQLDVYKTCSLCVCAWQ